MFAMKKLILAAFAIAAVVATSGNADATFAIRILNSSNTVLATVKDGQLAPIVGNTPQLIDGKPSDSKRVTGEDTGGNDTFTVITGGFSFTFSRFEGRIFNSGPTLSTAQLSVHVQSNSNAGGVVSFEFTRNGYTFPSGGTRKVFDSFTTIAPATGPVPASVTYQSWINAGNVDFSTAGQSNGPLSSAIPNQANSANTSGTINSTGVFSITTRTTFTFTGVTGTIQYDSRTDVTPPANIVPAPAGLLLSLLGLPALAFARRFRRAVPVQA